MQENGPKNQSLLRYAGFASVVAAAGIPLYIHLPAFLADRYGIGLAQLGALLLLLRLVDFVQDPALGWILSRFAKWRETIAATTAIILAAGMLGLFAIDAPITPILWIVGCLVLTFSGFSMLGILIYSDGVQRGLSAGHVSVAAWREAGTLVGITAAALLPFVLPGNGYAGFAFIYCAALLIMTFAMRSRWREPGQKPAAFGKVLADPQVRRFLLLAFLNAAPVAVTSTLFVFFVEQKLSLPGQAGYFLVLFFLSAAASTIPWRFLARKIGARRSLTLGMVIAIASFFWAYYLGPGNAGAFVAICIASGIALGADMMLLPALFSEQQARSGSDAAMSFGLWNFAGKATLALAAGVVLPLLGMSGFAPSNASDAGLRALGFYYAIVPCGLKVAALVMLWWFLPDTDAT